MKWIKDNFIYAGMIRMPIDDIFHYAIYVSDNEIIQFGEPPRLEYKIPDTDVRISITTLKSLKERFSYIEGAVFDENELNSRLDSEETVKLARSLVGTGGYSFLFNNCEHFVYRCIFGKPYSSQTEALRKRFRDIPVLDVYIAKIPDKIDYSPLYPGERDEEISLVTNETVKMEKYYAWVLLKIAIERSLGYDFNSLSFTKLEGGKWICDKCEFSISHSSGALAVAVSKKPVGIDIEGADRITNQAISKRILTNGEYEVFSSLPEEQKNEYLIRAWTAKEAYYKYNSSGVFSPSSIEVNSSVLHTDFIFTSDIPLYLSVVSEDIGKIRIFNDFKM